MGKRIAHQRPAFQRDETREKRADASDDGAHEDRLQHVLILQGDEQRLEHQLSSSPSARFFTTSSRPRRWLYSTCPPLPNTSGRSSSVSSVTARPSCFCTVDSSKRKCRSTPPNARNRFSSVNTSAIGPAASTVRLISTT